VSTHFIEGKDGGSQRERKEKEEKNCPISSTIKKKKEGRKRRMAGERLTREDLKCKKRAQNKGVTERQV